MEVLMSRRIHTLLVFVAVFGGWYCKSYEDSFNRQIDSTGLYVVNSGSNTVSQFAADPKSGTLSDLGKISAGTTPVSVTLNAARTFAYVVNSGSHNVYLYSINKTTRKLTYVSSVATETNPVMLAFTSGESYAFVSNAGSKTISRYSVNATTGELTSLGAAHSTTNTPAEIAIHNDYLFSAISDANEIRLFQITQATGVLSNSTNGFPAGTSRGVVIRGTGNNPFVYAAISTGAVVRSSFSTWATLVSTTAGTSPLSVAFNNDNTRALAANYGSGDISIYSVSSGALTATGTATACTNPAQVLFFQSTIAYVVCRGENKINAYTVAADALSLIGSYPTGTQPNGVAAY